MRSLGVTLCKRSLDITDPFGYVTPSRYPITFKSVAGYDAGGAIYILYLCKAYKERKKIKVRCGEIQVRKQTIDMSSYLLSLLLLHSSNSCSTFQAHNENEVQARRETKYEGWSVLITSQENNVHHYAYV